MEALISSFYVSRVGDPLQLFTLTTSENQHYIYPEHIPGGNGTFGAPARSFFGGVLYKTTVKIDPTPSMEFPQQSESCKELTCLGHMPPQDWVVPYHGFSAARFHRVYITVFARQPVTRERDDFASEPHQCRSFFVPSPFSCIACTP